jgi:hypothetical protein
VSEQRDEADAQDRLLESMAESIELLNVQSTVLNERVYTKNHLDRTRNFLIVASLVFFVISSTILGFVLLQIRHTDNREADRAEDRASEAILQRRQFADCQVPPGTPLREGLDPNEEPYINPGICFTETQGRANEFLGEAITRIFDGIRLSEDCIYLRSQGLRPPVCSEVNKRIDSLKANENPFRTTSSTISVGLLCSLLRLVGVVC